MLAAIMLFTANVSTAQTIVNGNFESPGVDSPDVYDNSREFHEAWCQLGAGGTLITGWTAGNNGLYYHVGKSQYVTNFIDGTCCVNLYKYSATGSVGTSISQNITGLVKGTTYYVYFDLCQYFLTDASLLTVNVGGETATYMNSAYKVWQTKSLPFIATGSTAKLTFSTPNSCIGEVLIDNVRITKTENGIVLLTPSQYIGVTVNGSIGKTYRIEYSQSATPATWNYFSRVTLTNYSTVVYDKVTYDDNKRFYRSVEE